MDSMGRSAGTSHPRPACRRRPDGTTSTPPTLRAAMVASSSAEETSAARRPVFSATPAPSTAIIPGIAKTPPKRCPRTPWSPVRSVTKRGAAARRVELERREPASRRSRGRAGRGRGARRRGLQPEDDAALLLAHTSPSRSNAIARRRERHLRCSARAALSAPCPSFGTIDPLHARAAPAAELRSARREAAATPTRSAADGASFDTGQREYEAAAATRTPGATSSAARAFASPPARCGRSARGARARPRRRLPVNERARSPARAAPCDADHHTNTRRHEDGPLPHRWSAAAARAARGAATVNVGRRRQTTTTAAPSATGAALTPPRLLRGLQRRAPRQRAPRALSGGGRSVRALRRNGAASQAGERQRSRRPWRSARRRAASCAVHHLGGVVVGGGDAAALGPRPATACAQHARRHHGSAGGGDDEHTSPLEAGLVGGRPGGRRVEVQRSDARGRAGEVVATASPGRRGARRSDAWRKTTPARAASALMPEGAKRLSAINGTAASSIALSEAPATLGPRRRRTVGCVEHPAHVHARTGHACGRAAAPTRVAVSGLPSPPRPRADHHVTSWDMAAAQRSSTRGASWLRAVSERGLRRLPAAAKLGLGATPSIRGGGRSRSSAGARAERGGAAPGRPRWRGG